MEAPLPPVGSALYKLIDPTKAAKEAIFSVIKTGILDN